MDTHERDAILKTLDDADREQVNRIASAVNRTALAMDIAGLEIATATVTLDNAQRMPVLAMEFRPRGHGMADAGKRAWRAAKAKMENRDG